MTANQVKIQEEFKKFCTDYGLNPDQRMIHGVTEVAKAAYLRGYSEGLRAGAEATKQESCPNCDACLTCGCYRCKCQ